MLRVSTPQMRSIKLHISKIDTPMVRQPVIRYAQVISSYVQYNAETSQPHATRLHQFLALSRTTR